MVVMKNSDYTRHQVINGFGFIGCDHFLPKSRVLFPSLSIFFNKSMFCIKKIFIFIYKFFFSIQEIPFLNNN